MKLFDNLRFFVRLILLAILSAFLLSCGNLTKQVRFYKQNPHLIPKTHQRVVQTTTVDADTLSQALALDISKQPGTTNEKIPLSRLYTFENARSKTTIAIDVAKITNDSLPIEVQTVVKPITTTTDTVLQIDQMVFTPEPKTSWAKSGWKKAKPYRWLALCALLMFTMLYRK